MGSVSKPYTENNDSSYRATWGTAYSANNINASGASINLPVSFLAKYTYSGKNSGFVSATTHCVCNGVSWASTEDDLTYENDRGWSSGTIKTIGTFNFPMTTNSLFSSANKTIRTLDVSLVVDSISLISWYQNAGGDMSLENSYYTGTASTVGNVATITLDAPPTFTASAISYDKGYVYAGLTTASVTISDSTALYGGDISASSFTIGTQTATGSGDGTLSILLDTPGTFTPTVTVTDSRGQVATKSLAPITVTGYNVPTVSFSGERTKSTGVPDDEGTYATLTATFTFDDVIATLQSPSVTMTDSNGTQTTPTVTWYSTRASNGTLSGSVTWASLSSGDTVYGLVSGLNTQYSYEIAIRPRDNLNTGTAISQTVGAAFYTVDFLAGGHGIAFGQPASQPGFWCNMDAHFADANSVMRALFDFVYPVGSYYETSDTSFDPNSTWGGTWTLEAEGQVHISSGANYAVSGALTDTTDGGEATVTLTETEMPSHTHGAYGNGYVPLTLKGGLAWKSAGSGSGVTRLLGDSSTTGSIGTNLANTGGGQAHNNMQPYIIVNRWHRTA